MHQIGEIIKSFNYGNDEENLYFKIEFLRTLNFDDSVTLKFISPKDFSIVISHNSAKLESSDGSVFCSLSFAYKDFLEIAISNKCHISNDENNHKMIIQSDTKDGQISYPNQGNITLEVV